MHWHVYMYCGFKGNIWKNMYIYIQIRHAHINSSLDVVRRWTHPDDKELVLDGNPITDIRRPELLDLGEWYWAGPQVLCPKMVRNGARYALSWQELATEDKTCSRNLGPLSKLLVLRQGDLADTPVSGWLFADSITVMQMMIVILCISSQAFDITHALSIPRH